MCLKHTLSGIAQQQQGRAAIGQIAHREPNLPSAGTFAAFEVTRRPLSRLEKSCRLVPNNWCALPFSLDRTWIPGVCECMFTPKTEVRDHHLKSIPEHLPELGTKAGLNGLGSCRDRSDQVWTGLGGLQYS